MYYLFSKVIKLYNKEVTKCTTEHNMLQKIKLSEYIYRLDKGKEEVLGKRNGENQWEFQEKKNRKRNSRFKNDLEDHSH